MYHVILLFIIIIRKGKGEDDSHGYNVAFFNISLQACCRTVGRKPDRGHVKNVQISQRTIRGLTGNWTGAT